MSSTFTVTIHENTLVLDESNANQPAPRKIYEQTVPDLDVPKLIATLNTKRRTRKSRAKVEAAR